MNTKMNGCTTCHYFAWVGEDELGSGEVGLKRGYVPAGLIPLVAIERHGDRMHKTA